VWLVQEVINGGSKAVSWLSNNAGDIGAGVGLVSMFLPPPANLIVGGIALGFSAWGAYQAYRQRDWAGVGLAAVGAIPGLGAAAKGFKALRAGKTAGRKLGQHLARKGTSRSAPGRRAAKNEVKRSRQAHEAAERSARRWDRATYPFAAYDAYSFGRKLWNASGPRKVRRRR
jgi:hypothetical protein